MEQFRQWRDCGVPSFIVLLLLMFPAPVFADDAAVVESEFTITVVTDFVDTSQPLDATEFVFIGTDGALNF